MFASSLAPPSTDLNRMLVAAYFTAASLYWNRELSGIEQRGDPDPTHLAFCFFLVKKLRGYADRLGRRSARHRVESTEGAGLHRRLPPHTLGAELL
jgi:hypothetical protein